MCNNKYLVAPIYQHVTCPERSVTHCDCCNETFLFILCVSLRTFQHSIHMFEDKQFFLRSGWKDEPHGCCETLL